MTGLRPLNVNHHNVTNDPTSFTFERLQSLLSHFGKTASVHVRQSADSAVLLNVKPVGGVLLGQGHNIETGAHQEKLNADGFHSGI